MQAYRPVKHGRAIRVKQFTTVHAKETLTLLPQLLLGSPPSPVRSRLQKLPLAIGITA
jgi:hypothetical protein